MTEKYFGPEELYSTTADRWEKEAIQIFGLQTVNNYLDIDNVNKILSLSVDKYWNNGDNQFKTLLIKKIRQFSLTFIKGSYEMVYEHHDTYNVALYATFYIIDLNGHYKIDYNNNPITKRVIIAKLPLFTKLGLFLYGSEYILRIKAEYIYSQLVYPASHNSHIIYVSKYKYNMETHKFVDKDAKYVLKFMSPYCRHLLEAASNKLLTVNNIEQAIKSVLSYNTENYSIIHFIYQHLDGQFNILKQSNKHINPQNKKVFYLDVMKMLIHHSKLQNNTITETQSQFILARNPIFNLENIRTIIYMSKYIGKYSFTFTDTRLFLDSFKTATNKAAGRSRLLNDNVYIEHNIMMIKTSYGSIDMYNAVYHMSKINIPNLSIMSVSQFSQNDAPKRIMMTAKLRGQALPLKQENNAFLHDINARIIFGDYQGFTYGDAIIISRSFAHRLQSFGTQIITNLNPKKVAAFCVDYQIGDIIPPTVLKELTQTTLYDNLRNIYFINHNTCTITIKYQRPFSVGDKITNMHGSKGIVSLILNDDDMPYLMSDAGVNMPAGPLDIIVSGLSVFKRRSLGSIFEAWALANNYTDIRNIEDAIATHRQELQDYGAKCQVKWHGTVTTKPLGINRIIRLYHDAVSKISLSTISYDSSKMLKLGEMELLNLASRGMNDIIRELDIRSISKYKYAYNLVQHLQQDRELARVKPDHLSFIQLFRSIGVDFQIGELPNFEQNLLKDYIDNITREKLLQQINMLNETEKEIEHEI